jgi:mono/diheme cytochrome c family protein
VIALLVLLAQAATPSPAPVAAAPRTPADIWMMKCKFCHGEDGKSRTKKGIKYKAPNFTGARWQKHTTDQEIVEAITNGVPKTKMPTFKDKLSPEEIQAMVPYLRAFAGKK